ncbi:MAG: cell division protein ZipA C-terminal FtsZ-binding domain-containing protein [Acidiferrobacterales bacterium]
MSLKIALLLVGVIIVITVAIGAMGKARYRRRRIRRSHPPDETSLSSIAVVDNDVHPGSPRADSGRKSPGVLGKRKLKTSMPAPKILSPPEDHSLLDEIESYEQVADLRLDVDPDIDSRVAESRDVQTSSPRDSPTVADKVIDFTISLPGKKTISHNRALGLFKQNEYMLEKPRAIYGLRHVTRVWTNLETDPDTTEYDDLMLALQMVDGSGAVGESELNTFVQMGLTFGDQFKRRTLFSLDVDEAIMVAEGLDAFCKQHDVIASVNVVANSPVGFPGNTIAAVANDMGLRFGEMDIFHRCDDRGQLEYSMANLFQPGGFDRENLEKFRTKGITFFLQVPCVLECVTVFSDMVTVAKQLADRMGGRVVDQDMKSLTDSGANTISAQIELIASDMRKRGIPPGAEAALRLFRI